MIEFLVKDFRLVVPWFPTSDIPPQPLTDEHIPLINTTHRVAVVLILNWMFFNTANYIKVYIVTVFFD